MPQDSALFFSGWDALHDLVSPLEQAGIQFILIAGRPGSDETRILSNGLNAEEDWSAMERILMEHKTKLLGGEG